MKNYILRISTTMFLILILIACNKDETNESLTDAIDLDEANFTAKVDTATEVLSDTFLQVYESEENLAKSPVHPYLPDCATIIVEITNASKEVTIDFGSEGCDVRGHLIKGKLNMSYVASFEAETLVINYDLEDFFIDDIQFSGSKTVTRQKMNDNGNPQYTMELDLNITFEDGTVASRKGTKTREWIEGALNGNWGDNVFLISGSWETNFVNGNTHSTTIITPLRREASCRFLVSGVVDLVRTNYTGTLNYGDGMCDNIALFINEEGEEREIKL
ncbi:hypothetical protein ABW636_14795 [Aquimarina sp. 2201CG1-2-11]|uniref:hypothetical protein n=1 Tax=Aquimarina discodermiae TaxID=3231043 RepID=UPI0034635D61